jgi:beta-galactosidase
MRNSVLLNRNWTFYGPNGTPEAIDLPHTWNGVDGQDGGNDYWRGTCTYETTFPMPQFDPDSQTVYLEFQGVNATADVELNGTAVIHHDGGYSTFRAEVAGLLRPENHLSVRVDNSVNDRVYPQKADFTFYGGIYRDVTLLVVRKHHFDLGHLGGPGLRVTPTVDGTTGKIRVESWTNVEDPTVEVTLTDAEGTIVASGQGADVTLDIPDVHLWDGVKDPYLYTATLRLVENGTAVDEISCRFGVRTFRVDPKEGFFLNGRPYPLHGVSRHQDRKGLGNALTRAHHDEDMALIREMGANTIRLAHYQHDQYFYDLCDQYGMLTWAEIPYISEHMPNGRENTISQMKELITQNYNHPSIVTWGLSNEITISTKDKADMLDNHRALNDLCHAMDATRPTSLACYAMCGPFNPSAHISDLVSWNLYLGWYVPGLFLNDLWISFFHLVYPKRCLGYSEYGCEGMPNLHSPKPRRGDHTEEYQAIYHEFMLKCFQRHPYLWSTHVWNMFDFAADARDQGGEPGMNHKGLVTFDRKTKKDSFYLYKAYWSEKPFVHLCGSRYTDRTEQVTTVKVYSNQSEVSLYANGKLVGTKSGKKVFTFQVSLDGQVELEARAGECRDTIQLQRVEKPNDAYRLKKGKSSSANWV